MDRREFIRATGVTALGLCRAAAAARAPGAVSVTRPVRPPGLTLAWPEGARVRLTGGVFNSCEGLLVAVDEVGGVARVEFTMHGRAVPVEAPLSQIELIDGAEA